MIDVCDPAVMILPSHVAIIRPAYCTCRFRRLVAFVIEVLRCTGCQYGGLLQLIGKGCLTKICLIVDNAVVPSKVERLSGAGRLEMTFKLTG